MIATMQTNARFSKRTDEDKDKIVYAGDLSKFGQEFQIKLLSLLIKDRVFAFSIIPIIKDEYFSDIFLRKIYICVKEYVEQYTSCPTIDNVKILLRTKGEKIVIYDKLLEKIENVDLSDRDFVIDNSRKFCFSKYALLKTEEIKVLLEQGDFEKAKKISIEAFKHTGEDNRKVYDLRKDYDKIFNDDVLHRPVETPFPTINKSSKGGPGSGNLVIMVAPSNFGKCFAKGTKIRMYDLSLKNIEDIKSGDKLLGPDGKPRIVDTLATGFEEMFEVEQKNGLNYTVNKSHILCLKRSKYYISGYKDRNEFIDITVEDYLKQKKWWKKCVKGYKAPQEFKVKELRLDPYYLGLWLGDGSHNVPTIHNVDKEVIENIREYSKEFPTIKFKCKEKTKISDQELTWTFTDTMGKKNPITKLLESYNLIKNKHIPDDYLFSSRAQRLQLLAGILDSDGYLENVTKTCFQISQKRKELAWQIYILASSLGFKTNFSDEEYSSVSIMGDTHLIPTKIKRKQALKRKKNYDTTTSEINIVPKGIGQYFGFTLKDGVDRKFLLEDYTVVHNTAALTAVARHANSTGKNVAFFSFEIGGVDIIRRYIAGVLHINQEDLKFHKDKVKDIFINAELGNFRLIEERATKATVDQIKMDLDYLKSTGFYPDMICVDSLNQLKLLGEDRWRMKDDNQKFEYLAEELRDLANELEIPIYTVMQTNRGGFVNKINDIQSIGKAIEPFQVADLVIMFSQTPEMFAEGKCVALVAKNRLGPKNIALECSYDPNQGSFKELKEVPELLLLSSEQKQEVRAAVTGTREKLRLGYFDTKKTS